MDPLREPLLDSSRPTARSDQNSDALTPPTGLFTRLVRLLRRLRDACYSLWHRLLSLFISQKPPVLTETQTARFNALVERAAIAFDNEDEQHIKLLRSLWMAVWGDDIPLPTDVRQHNQWKMMGFQRDIPASDFRGGGLLSLQLLVYTAENENALFLDLMNKVQGPRSDLDYPFAAAGINLTHMLVQDLGLRRNNSIMTTQPPHVLGFLRMLERSDTALETVYIEAHKELERLWIETGATYMEFPSVIKQVQKSVHRMLRDYDT